VIERGERLGTRRALRKLFLESDLRVKLKLTVVAGAGDDEDIRIRGREGVQLNI
jgi:hypothetical protein